MPRPWRKVIAGLLALPLFFGHAACQATADADGGNWLNHGGPVDQSGFSPLTDIGPATVSRLGLAWSLDLADEQTLEATPLAVDGTLYFTGSTSAVYAVDAASGRLLWRYDPEIGKHDPTRMRWVFGANRGAAYWNGAVFVGTIDGRLISLDARTGQPRWSVQTIAPAAKNTITGAPLVFDGRVMIGNGGADWAARGYVTAYDAKTGKQLWRFYTVPTDPAAEPRDDAMRLAAKTWGGDWWKIGGGGGTVWDGMTYDPELKRVYIGTGNSGPYDPRVRSPGNGDNLFLASIVALDAETGKYIWHYQVNPREAWDYKATANMVMATLPIDGKPRKVLMQSPTNGFFYVLDRETGKLLSAAKTGKVTWADHIDLSTGRPAEAPNIRYEHGSTTMWPSPFGTHNWQAMSYSSLTGLVYIPYMQLGATWTATGPSSRSRGVSLGGVSIAPARADPDDGTGALLAWDPVAQRPRWKAPLPHIWNGGTMVTAGGLVFQGDADGFLTAYDAKTGVRLWHFDAKLGIVAAPISYRANGKQYISILVGYGGATALWSQITNRGWKYGLQPRRLLTFTLDGKTNLPPTAAADFTVHAVDDPHVRIDDAKAAAGRALFAANCAMCHGAELRSAGAPAPDLRESGNALDPSIFKTIVQGGALAERGMPIFPALSDEDVATLFMYVRAAAREALGLRSADHKPAQPNHF